MSDFTINSRHRSFGGETLYCSHFSKSNNCKMNFALISPVLFEKNLQLPVMFYLSGLTCTEENFTVKSGVQSHLKDFPFLILVPDTSPRQLGLPGEDEDTSFGTGASYYFNATQPPYSKHYKMYDYVVNDLVELTEKINGPTPYRGIFGHSMGGHGALMIGLRNQDIFSSISAFAPISSLFANTGRHKAFEKYLGGNKDNWKPYDVINCLSLSKQESILIDIGSEDEFASSLRVDLLQEAAKRLSLPVTINTREGFDHSYYFVASFLKDHLEYHWRKYEE